MKNIVNKIKELFNSLLNKTYLYYFLILLGFCMLSLYLYVNFFRIRLPRDIPFNLWELTFYLLLYICIMYSYIIFRIFKPKNPPIFIIRILQKINYPFRLLDYFIKNITFLKPYYERMRNRLISFLITFGDLEMALLLILFEFIPRFILVSLLLRDVFWINRIETFYCFILIGIIPFLFRYFQYSLYVARAEYIQYLDSLYDDVWVLDKYSEYKPIWDKHPDAIYHDKRVSIEEYLRIQEENSLEEYPEDFAVEYYAIPGPREETIIKYEQENNKTNTVLEDEDYDLIKKPFYDNIETLISFHSYLETTKVIPYIYNIPYMKVFLYSLYLVCWAYILFKSFHTVIDWPITLKVLEIITMYTPKIEPFSNTFL